MSSVCVLEPPTRGKVVLNTTYGPFDMELWPKEAPKAARNFVQLCLEGYYDNTIFHRIIKSFLVQGGDPTGSGTGGESIYGGAFSDEFHSRLRFKHRGLVACANAGTPHSNGSQFFVTLIGVIGLIRRIPFSERLLVIPFIICLGWVRLRPARTIARWILLKCSVEVLWNPFDDISPRTASRKSLSHSIDTEKQEQKWKAVKKLNLLSFGEEAEEEENDMAVVKEKIKSSHDVLNDPRLLKDETSKKEMNEIEIKKTQGLQLSVREALSSKKEETEKESESGLFNSHEASDEDEAQFDARMRSQIFKKRQEFGDLPIKQKSRTEGC